HARWEGARRHGRRSQDTVRSTRRPARRIRRGEAADSHAGLRVQRRPLARRPVDRVHVHRNGTGDLRAAVSRGRRRPLAGLRERPVWARSARELFYLDARGRLMSVPVQIGASFSAGTPVLLLRDPIDVTGPPGTTGGRTYAVSRDGRRFLIIKNAERREPQAGPELMVVLNWDEELKRLAPAR